MLYQHWCPDCGEMELERKMSAPTPTKCPRCHKNILQRDYTTIHFVRPVDMHQENENGGLGKYYPSLGNKWLDPKTKTKPNPKAYSRTRDGAIESAKRQGLSVEKA